MPPSHYTHTHHCCFLYLQDFEQQDDDPLKKLRDQHKGMVTCRLCKGDHWTSRCPYKDSLGPNTMKELEESGISSSQHLPHFSTVVVIVVNAKPESAPSGAAAGGGAGAASTGGGKYVPPNQRGGERERKGEMLGGSRMGRDGECGVCVRCCRHGDVWLCRRSEHCESHQLV